MAIFDGIQAPEAPTAVVRPADNVEDTSSPDLARGRAPCAGFNPHLLHPGSAEHCGRPERALRRLHGWDQRSGTPSAGRRPRPAACTGPLARSGVARMRYRPAASWLCRVATQGSTKVGRAAGVCVLCGAGKMFVCRSGCETRASVASLAWRGRAACGAACAIHPPASACHPPLLLARAMHQAGTPANTRAALAPPGVAHGRIRPRGCKLPHLQAATSSPGQGPATPARRVDPDFRAGDRPLPSECAMRGGIWGDDSHASPSPSTREGSGALHVRSC